jgi:ankyrin repeat protein
VDVNVPDNEDCTPLHVAPQSGDREIAELLLGSSASIDARNNEQRTPLAFVCEYGKRDMAHFRIVRDSDANSQVKAGSVPLHAASQNGYIDVQVEERWTALHLASRYGYLDIARLLTERDADLNSREIDHWIPVHLASSVWHPDIVKLLIDRGANVDSQTRLHFA